MSFDPDSEEIRTTFFNKRGSIDTEDHTVHGMDGINSMYK